MSTKNNEFLHLICIHPQMRFLHIHEHFTENKSVIAFIIFQKVITTNHGLQGHSRLVTSIIREDNVTSARDHVVIQIQSRLDSEVFMCQSIDARLSDVLVLTQRQHALRRCPLSFVARDTHHYLYSQWFVHPAKTRHYIR